MGKINRIQAILRQVDLENHSSRNWELIHEAPQCGCYYCTQVFSSSEVNDFEENENGEKGAVCPYCGIMQGSRGYHALITWLVIH